VVKRRWKTRQISKAIRHAQPGNSGAGSADFLILSESFMG
jgi:hypothetical protein